MLTGRVAASFVGVVLVYSGTAKLTRGRSDFEGVLRRLSLMQNVNGQWVCMTEVGLGAALIFGAVIGGSILRTLALAAAAVMTLTTAILGAWLATSAESDCGCFGDRKIRSGGSHWYYAKPAIRPLGYGLRNGVLLAASMLGAGLSSSRSVLAGFGAVAVILIFGLLASIAHWSAQLRQPWATFTSIEPLFARPIGPSLQWYSLVDDLLAPYMSQQGSASRHNLLYNESELPVYRREP